MKPHRSLLLLALCFVSVVAARADDPLVIHLWEKGAPGFESRRDEPEIVKGGSVTNVHNPSITVFPAPKDKANGAAVIIVPGGGHRQLGFIGEGVEPAKFMNDLGITAFVLKHRLPREPNSPYSLDIHPRQDIQRAMRLIRSRAAEWNLDPKRIGAMGFSAGGETVAMLVYSPSAGDPQAADPIDRVDCPCDFQISIYPGPLGIPSGPIPADAPPAFFVVAHDDKTNPIEATLLYLEYKKHNIPAELHIMTKGGHGFGMRKDKNPINEWPARCGEWLQSMGLLGK